MGLSLNFNAMNQVVKGVTIYEEHEPLESICLVLKGRVHVHRDGMQMLLGTGNFLGICDLYTGQANASYTAFDNTVVYPFPVKGGEDIPILLESNPDYGGVIVASLNRYIRDLTVSLRSLLTAVDEMTTFLQYGYETYLKEGKRSGFPVYPLAAMEKLKPYEKSDLLDMHKADYYSECAGILVEVQKAYYQNNIISLYHIEEQTELGRQLVLEHSEVAAYLTQQVGLLLNYGEECLFKRITNLIINLNKKEINPSRILLELVERIVENINNMDVLLEKRTGKRLEINREELENLYYAVISGQTQVEEVGDTVKAKMMQLVHSMDIILDYGKIEPETQEEFKGLVNDYQNLKDKTSIDDGSRALRRKIASLHYEIYEKVFLNAYGKKDCPLAVELYLKYGFLSETLMREEQLEELVQLEPSNSSASLCKVYDMKTWLSLIYSGKKLPSKSEFDLDFEEHIRSLRKTNEITEEAAKTMLMDMKERLHYEIHNLFSYNSRLISGQMGLFIPFLTENSFVTSIRKAFVNGEMVNHQLDQFREVDYSLFYRETLVEFPELGNRREYVLKEVFPDIILFPISGENAVMWQDISGRKRDSKGRILMPVFTVKKLDEILIRVIGRYRWECCRTAQGANWNNIKEKSLTSEYMDYLQFYRKNKDLSDDKKERLKSQIQKCRSNSREVFAMDYELWIKNESEGAIRLNKVAREMLATYCPFSKGIRENVKNQPMFVDAMNRYNREKLIKVKELDLRHRAMEKDGISIPEPIIETLQFYQNM